MTAPDGITHYATQTRRNSETIAHLAGASLLDVVGVGVVPGRRAR
jgi:hypothetical protein